MRFFSFEKFRGINSPKLETDVGLYISENYEYYISDNGNLNKVSKDYFIKNGINLSTNSKSPIDNSKIFKIDIDDKKVIGHFV